MTFRALAFGLSLCVSLPAFAADPAKPAAATKSKTRAPAAPVDEKNLPDVVAKVNGIDIKKVELQNAIETMKMDMEMIGQRMPPDRKDEIWRDMLDKIIDTELLVQDTKSKKISATEAEVDTELAKFREKFPSEQVFQTWLGEQGFSEPEIRDEFRKSLGVSKMIKQHVHQKIKIVEKDAKDYYDKNPEQFQEPEQFRASHVLVKVDKAADEATKAAARKKIEKVLADAKAGKDFATLARENSDDPGSKNQGGDLDWFGKGMMVPSFEEAVIKLAKPGDLSDIVETPYGFHVIRLTEKKAPHVIPFAEVKEDLLDFISAKKKDESLRGYVESLRSKAKVQIFI